MVGKKIKILFVVYIQKSAPCGQTLYAISAIKKKEYFTHQNTRKLILIKLTISLSTKGMPFIREWLEWKFPRPAFSSMAWIMAYIPPSGK